MMRSCFTADDSAQYHKRLTEPRLVWFHYVYLWFCVLCIILVSVVCLDYFAKYSVMPMSRSTSPQKPVV